MKHSKKLYLTCPLEDKVQIHPSIYVAHESLLEDLRAELDYCNQITEYIGQKRYELHLPIRDKIYYRGRAEVIRAYRAKLLVRYMKELRRYD